MEKYKFAGAVSALLYAGITGAADVINVGPAITENQGNILVNSSNARINSMNISLNSANIYNNQLNVSVNSENAYINSGNIYVNSGNISNVSQNIMINSNNVWVNSANIAVNAMNIQMNAGNIQAAEQRISTVEQRRDYQYPAAFTEAWLQDKVLYRVSFDPDNNIPFVDELSFRDDGMVGIVGLLNSADAEVSYEVSGGNLYFNGDYSFYYKVVCESNPVYLKADAIFYPISPPIRVGSVLLFFDKAAALAAAGLMDSEIPGCR